MIKKIWIWKANILTKLCGIRTLGLILFCHELQSACYRGQGQHGAMCSNTIIHDPIIVQKVELCNWCTADNGIKVLSSMYTRIFVAWFLQVLQVKFDFWTRIVISITLIILLIHICLICKLSNNLNNIHIFEK